VHGKLMLLGVLKGQGTEPARVGIITSRRVGGAVQRNGMRRRIREIVRPVRSQLLRGLWMVVIVKHPAVEASFAGLRDEWSQLARKAGCFPA
jgi:ribonuclease P protein component